ncbi:LacI family DNA-binding transcriptional regulator [Streptomyces iranensis]|uniref:LacI family DNA-binding transcriptional regulator n=1 Tax=Streptomyces iranensis TaxID=576784 RepID=UPI0039B77897
MGSEAGTGPPRRVTIREVAARTGVSKGAVSLTFNGRPGASRATRDRIFAAARELGYRPPRPSGPHSGAHSSGRHGPAAAPGRAVPPVGRGLEPRPLINRDP